jgi:hypothetical protein
VSETKTSWQGLFVSKTGRLVVLNGTYSSYISATDCKLPVRDHAPVLGDLMSFVSWLAMLVAIGAYLSLLTVVPLFAEGVEYM